MLTSAEGSLIIRNVSFANSGPYKCILTNVHGNDSLLIDVHVQGQQLRVTCITSFYILSVSVLSVEPVVLVSPLSSLRLGGESLSLSCMFFGYPAPSVTWIFDDIELPLDSSVSVSSLYNSTEFIVSSELRLYNLTYNNSGQYYCQAENFLVIPSTSFSDVADITINCKS